MINLNASYTGAYGRIRAYSSEFLSEETFRDLLQAKNVEDLSSKLYSTLYRSDMDTFSAINKGLDLIELSLNHRLIMRNRIALFAAPTPARDIIRSYLSKWDVENIKSIISAKYMGYGIKDTENFLISFRDIPLGLFGGNLTHDDFKVLLSKDTIEDVVNYLSNFGYGQFMLQYMERYRKSGDVGILLFALDNYYYLHIFESLKFFNGDEGPVRSFFSDTVDLRNAMIILKAISLNVEFDRIKESLIPFGTVLISKLQDAHRTGNIKQAVLMITGNQEIAGAIPESGTKLGDIELSLREQMLRKYISIFSEQALSVSFTFAFIIKSELERERIRSIAMGKFYTLDEKTISRMAMP